MSNRIRVFYEGDPATARVELIVMNALGIASVHDIPCEAVTVHFAKGARASCVLQVGEGFVTVHSEGPIDSLKEQALRRLASLPELGAQPEVSAPPATEPELTTIVDVPFEELGSTDAITKVETPNPKPRRGRTR